MLQRHSAPLSKLSCVKSLEASSSVQSQGMCCRPEYSWSTNQIKAYWVSFKTADERRRALEMNNRFLVSCLVFLTQATPVPKDCHSGFLCFLLCV